MQIHARIMRALNHDAKIQIITNKKNKFKFIYCLKM